MRRRTILCPHIEAGGRAGSLSLLPHQSENVLPIKRTLNSSGKRFEPIAGKHIGAYWASHTRQTLRDQGGTAGSHIGRNAAVRTNISTTERSAPGSRGVSDEMRCTLFAAVRESLHGTSRKCGGTVLTAVNPRARPHQLNARANRRGTGKWHPRSRRQELPAFRASGHSRPRPW
jgi:hypothetical protein